MFANGLAEILNNDIHTTTLISSKCGDFGVRMIVKKYEKIIVYIPKELYFHLNMLNLLSLILMKKDERNRVIVLSCSIDFWLKNSLESILEDSSPLNNVVFLNSNLHVETLAKSIQQNLDNNQIEHDTLLQKELKETYHGKWITHKELRAVLMSIEGYSVNDMAKKYGISIKTLYNHKKKGFKKLMLNKQSESNRINSDDYKITDLDLTESLSVLEGSFVNDILCGNVYPVFQPILNDEFFLTGAEILIRWEQNGKLLQPSEFLPQIRSRYVWFRLTELVLNEAIKNINRYCGTYFFSINIPSNIIGKDIFLKMIESSIKKLQFEEYSEQLILEFPEGFSYDSNSETVKVINSVQDLGCRVFLDDCFSKGSVIFPVRDIQFKGFKLDMGIVNNFLGCTRDRYLIQTLVYYCKLVNLPIIAEGINDLKCVDGLKELGVNNFQGYLFSPPIKQQKFQDLIMRQYGNQLNIGGNAFNR